jgi:hypothetical protein
MKRNCVLAKTKRLIWLAGLGLVFVLFACSKPPRPDAIEAFLSTHWQDPLPAQGMPPASDTPLEASLAPESCGTCHVHQYRDWQTALHSHTMGPGIYWQLEILGQTEGNRCLRCHAPLAEQKALLAREMNWPNAPASPPPAYVPASLAHDGLVCAACHVRGHIHYGPPRSGPTLQAGPHGGFVPEPAFLDSRFCAHCHQFPDDGPRLAGKLREDTYQQWLASSYAPRQPCQSCHMPNGRHLWRGIHDPDMVRKALAVELHLKRLANDGEYEADIVARNQGAGHDLPTYLVPKISLVLNLSQPGHVPRELARDVIGWQADIDIKHEAFDTRIPAGGSRRYTHAFRPPKGPWEVELRVDVAPAEHYERMFRYSLEKVSLSPQARATLKRALQDALATRFTAMQIAARP